MAAGELVPDKLVIDLVKERLAAAAAQQGFILDGFPRNTAQAVTLDSELSALGREIDCALLVDVAPEGIIDRLEKGIMAAGPVTNLLMEHDDPESLLRRVMADFELEILETVPVEYRC